MKRTRLGWAVGAVLFLGCATTASSPRQLSGAQAEAAESAEGQDAAEAAPRELICETVATTGSHLKKRVCRTVEVVEAEREDAQRRMQNLPKINPEMSN